MAGGEILDIEFKVDSIFTGSGHTDVGEPESTLQYIDSLLLGPFEQFELLVDDAPGDLTIIDGGPFLGELVILRTVLFKAVTAPSGFDIEEQPFG